MSKFKVGDTIRHGLAGEMILLFKCKYNKDYWVGKPLDDSGYGWDLEPNYPGNIGKGWNVTDNEIVLVDKRPSVIRESLREDLLK